MSDGSMSAVFMAAVAHTLDFEGGLVDDKNDAGGLTNFGISQRAYPYKNIAGLTRDDAIAIYHTDYWVKYNIGQLPDLIAPKVFDTCVLCGPHYAITLMQHILGVAEDGVIGAKTAIRARTMSADVFLDAYDSALVAHYNEIVKQHPEQARFLRGWERRALD